MGCVFSASVVHRIITLLVFHLIIHRWSTIIRRLYAIMSPNLLHHLLVFLDTEVLVTAGSSFAWLHLFGDEGLLDRRVARQRVLRLDLLQCLEEMIEVLVAGRVRRGLQDRLLLLGRLHLVGLRFLVRSLRAPAVDRVLVQNIDVDRVDVLVVALRQAVVVLVGDALVEVVEAHVDHLLVVGSEGTLAERRGALARQTDDASLAEARHVRLVD